MPIANILKSIDVPVIGKSLFRTEDQFLPSDFAMSNGPLGEGGSDATIPQEIIISCKNKRRRICGYLSEGVKLNGQSNWEFFTQGIGIDKLAKGLGTVNTLAQLGFTGTSDNKPYGAGASIQQPWVNRKFWKDSSPFTLDFNFNFVSETSSKEDVFLPAIALLSFCYPRAIDDTEIVKVLKNSITNLQNKVADWTGGVTTGTNTKDNKSILDAGKDALRMFAIPGPSLMYGAKGNEEGQQDLGDAVTIVVGNMFAFGACYLKTVNLEFSPSFDYSGYPVWCKCQIQAEAMDSNICASDGSFMYGNIPDYSNNMAELLRSLQDIARQAAEDAVNIAKTTMNAIGAFPQLIKG